VVARISGDVPTVFSRASRNFFRERTSERSGELVMSKPLFFIGLLMFFAAGCMPADRSSASPATQPISAAAADKCVLSQPIKSPAPQNTEGGPPSAEVRSWFVNADRSIWMFDVPRVAGERTKTAWFRPARTKLEVTGRRLDGDAQPLFVETSPSGEEYRHMFQPSIMIFPTAGCWEITAKAATSEARFVVKVNDAP
jgi:hypothetical protein